MLINWKQPRLLKAGSSQENSVLMLKPGVNDVDAAKWEVASKTTLFKHYLDHGDLEIIQGQNGEKISSSDISKLKDREAVKLVKDTNDEGLLKGWLAVEKRPSVVAAIESQAAKVAAETAPVKK